jgi:hypothetical protein
MPTIDLGIIDVTFNINYPTIDFGLELKIPHHIPKYGGKTYRLDSFSLSLTQPTITIGIDPFHAVGGSVTVELNFPRCEVQVSGEVTLDLKIKHHHWKVGPVNIPYMNPLSFAEPSWSVNPITPDLATLQSLVNSAPAPESAGGPSLKNDAATQAEILALLIFSGAATLIDDLISAAVRLSANLQRDLASRPDHPLAKRLAANTGGWVIAFGNAASLGALIGGSVAQGFYVTTDGDFGTFGSVGGGVGVIAELSEGACAIVYWPDAGQTALDSFQGNNYFVAVDAGEILSVGYTISWPASAKDVPLSVTPCGVSVFVGIGGGLPFNFFVGNSHTWLNLQPPPSMPPIHPA